MDEASSDFRCETVEAPQDQVNRDHYPEYRAAFMKRYGELCSYCSAPVSLLPKEGMRIATVDHIVPRVGGGTDAADNLTVACSVCNTSKCNMPLEQYLAKKGLSPSTVNTFSGIDAAGFKSLAAKRKADRWAGTALIAVKLDSKTRRILQRRADRDGMCLTTYVKRCVMLEMDRKFGKGWEVVGVTGIEPVTSPM
jgi:hypothetical protein